MSNQEEQHKTWRMLKKAVTLVPFTSSIIPVFTSDSQSVIDKYGEWKFTWEYDAESSYKNSSRDVSKNIYKLFDGVGDTTTMIQLTTSHYKARLLTIILELPPKVYIKPEAMRFFYYTHGGNRFCTISGCKQNGEWDELISRTDMWKTVSKEHTFTDADFYNKFKIYLEQTYSSSGERYMHANEFRISKGILKIGG
jgi:hypothetical protein